MEEIDKQLDTEYLEIQGNRADRRRRNFRIIDAIGQKGRKNSRHWRKIVLKNPMAFYQK